MSGHAAMSNTCRQGVVVGAMVGAVALGCASGCATERNTSWDLNQASLKRQALDRLKTALTCETNVAVRVEAVEALRQAGVKRALPWLRSALLDNHPAVRFAACVASGELQDADAEAAIRLRSQDEDANVRVAALFALHRLGDTARTGELTGYLLHHRDLVVRRHAAWVLGLLGEPSAIKVLARAMRDVDSGVRNYALEAMARLGNKEARQELAFMTNASVGADEVFAIHALIPLRDPHYLDTFRYKFESAAHLETRLAAARGMATLGVNDGFDIALNALTRYRPVRGDVNDPPAGQSLRVKQLAAAALGSMKRGEALPTLERMLETSTDLRLQVSAAQAILQIVNAERDRMLSTVLASDGDG